MTHHGSLSQHFLLFLLLSLEADHLLSLLPIPRHLQQELFLQHLPPLLVALKHLSIIRYQEFNRTLVVLLFIIPFKNFDSSYGKYHEFQCFKYLYNYNLCTCKCSFCNGKTFCLSYSQMSSSLFTYYRKFHHKVHRISEMLGTSCLSFSASLACFFFFSSKTF